MGKDAIEQGKGGQLLHNMAEMEGRTCLACRLGRFAAERHWRSLAPRHAPRASDSPTAITKNSATANAVALFLAGAEGLGLRSRSGRLVACVPPARTRPSARGFGVDVGERTREREKADVIRFPPQVPERAVLVWCCELFLEKDCASTTTSSFERTAPPPGGWPS